MDEMDREDHIPVEKPASRQLFFALLFLLIVLMTGFSFVISPAFSIGTILVEGNKYLTVEEVHQIAGIPDKINIFRLNTAEIQSKLHKDLRVEQAALERKFPSALMIHITERKPIAYIACDYGFVEVDKDGMVLAAHKTMKHIRVPIVTGITLHDLYVGDTVADAFVARVLEYLSYLDESAVNQLSEVNVSAPDQLVAYTTGSVQIRIGVAERLQDKARLTQDFIGELQVTKLPIEFIDLNFASPYIKFKK